MGKRPKKSAPKSKEGFISKAKGKVKEKIFGKDKKSGNKGRRKKSALWYAKEIQRLKLKKRFEKVKFGIMR